MTAGAPLPVLPSRRSWPLHGLAATRRLEAAGLAATAPHALMAAAGLATARLALALCPPGAPVWIAAGPGNNGGDGLVAAAHLQRWGLPVRVCWLGHPDALPDDARDARAQAQAASVPIDTSLPADPPTAGLAIDALLGIGATRAPAGEIARAIALLNAAAAPVLAVDVPSGLCAGTGRVLGDDAVRAAHTLSLLTLKPGLFTAAGREHAGRVWFHGLGSAADAEPADAVLSGPPPWAPRRHGQHKGSFGDVAVIGGAPGMGGAALLAARAALTAGAGRVFVARLDDTAALAVDPARPELMPRRAADLARPESLAAATVVCGCGGGEAVRTVLPAVLAHAARLVLDADGLNAVAGDALLADLLAGRAARGLPSLLTPHPLEAARLLGCSAPEVQADRLGAARRLVERFGATVVLKGSGSVVASAGTAPAINPTGNARLGSAGTGDVLAGWLGGAWAQRAEDAPQAVASAVAWWHGQAAESGDERLPLRAADLVDAMAASISA